MTVLEKFVDQLKANVTGTDLEYLQDDLKTLTEAVFVVDITTKQITAVYPSVEACSQDTGVAQTTLRMHISSGVTVKRTNRAYAKLFSVHKHL